MLLGVFKTVKGHTRFLLEGNKEKKKKYEGIRFDTADPWIRDPSIGVTRKQNIRPPACGLKAFSESFSITRAQLFGRNPTTQPFCYWGNQNTNVLRFFLEFEIWIHKPPPPASQRTSFVWIWFISLITHPNSINHVNLYRWDNEMFFFFKSFVIVASIFKIFIDNQPVFIWMKRTRIFKRNALY